MPALSGGLGDMIRQDTFAGRGSLAERTARNYGAIISGITVAILLLTLWRFRTAPQALAPLLAALAIYVGYGILRAHVPAVRLYHPHAQLARCQAGILGVTLLIGALAAQGVTDHELWLLYVLATLALSEGVSTSAVLATLVEVAGLLLGASYVGGRLAAGAWPAPATFIAGSAGLVVRILWIWLITFVLHYLVRNVQAREAAFRQHRAWLALIEEKALVSEDPAEQRGAVLASAAELTHAAVELWTPRLSDGRLVDAHGACGDATVEAATGHESPSAVLATAQAHQGQGPTRLVGVLAAWLSGEPYGRPHGRPHGVIGCLTILPPSAGDDPAVTRVLVPIHRFDGSRDLLGVLDCRYGGRTLSSYRLERQVSRLQDFVGHARVVLASRTAHEQQQVVDRLAAGLSGLLDVNAIAERVSADIVEQIGFDFATVSVVDTSQGLIRCIAGKNARWVDDSRHARSSDDIQSRVVREGIVYQNDGSWEPCLDRRIWRQHLHHQMSRVWVPIRPQGAAAGSEAVLGTIEAGFRHEHSRTISPALVALLQRYAEHVHLMLLNAQRLGRTRALVDALTGLHEMGARMQRQAALCEPQEMAWMVGQGAERLLQADIVTVYRLEASHEKLDLLYFTPTPEAIKGKGELALSLRQDGVLHKLAGDRTPHFSSDALADPILANLDADGRPVRGKRTFTQRQNVKSFAGLPLIGKGGDVRGFLCVNFRSRHEFHAEERQIIKLYAEQAAVALEETDNHHFLRSLIISQERTSLAAELHHSLSQNLFALDSYARAADVYSGRGDLEATRRSLAGIMSTAGQSLRAVEELLNELRERPKPETDFVAEMTAYVERLRSQGGSQIQFAPEVRGDVARQMQFYLLRIAREAVNNAVRHAPGAAIRVIYDVDAGGGITLQVQDNGPGFDIEKAWQSGRYGLATMQYYAYKINSYLSTESAPGCTKVSVRVTASPPEDGHDPAPGAQP